MTTKYVLVESLVILSHVKMMYFCFYKRYAIITNKVCKYIVMINFYGSSIVLTYFNKIIFFGNKQIICTKINQLTADDIFRQIFSIIKLQIIFLGVNQ